MMCDCNSKYMTNAIPYIGKGTVPEGLGAGEYFITKLVETVKIRNRDITMDNWFTSLPLLKKLRTEYELKAIGTLKNNKKELPTEFRDVKYRKRSTKSSFSFFQPNITAVSCKPKPDKLVTLVSTLHCDSSIITNTGKPEMTHKH
ncbi:unnamed protein product [Hermetia illucens]|uniref:PiggyBac transposable element-derived protein domain-containing protein n=1 Tax=Hermetia illucens TaxID=343691 RepID=A0A7R8UIP0_HERIL|nr:unnamed protein product [Hermetia illucens]